MLPIQKKSRARAFNVKPFPTEIFAVSYFTGYDFEIFDKTSIKTLYESGCYGLNPKPRHVLTFNQQQKMKSMTEAEFERRLEWKEQFGESEIAGESVLVGKAVQSDPFCIPQSLVLFLEEAFFLHHTIKCLEVRDLEENLIQTEDLWMKLCKLKEKFVECFVAFLYLKSKNWVIKSGMKFGGDFLLYKQSPQLYHASFIVIVSRHGEKSSYEYHTNERIAETTGKNLLYLDVYFPEDLSPADYLSNLDKFEVKEISIQRHEMIKQK